MFAPAEWYLPAHLVDSIPVVEVPAALAANILGIEVAVQMDVQDTVEADIVEILKEAEVAPAKAKVEAHRIHNNNKGPASVNNQTD